MSDTATETEAGVLGRAVEEFFRAMLGLGVAPADSYEPAPRETAGTVAITGDVSIALVVRMPVVLATGLTAAMFGTAADAVSGEEVADALGEVANVVAGALKGSLDADCRLSLPSVTEGRDLRIGVPGGAVRTEVCFESDGHRFAVQAWVRAD